MKVSRLVPKPMKSCRECLKRVRKSWKTNVRSNLTAVIGKDLKEKSRSTGQLLSALGTSGALQDRNGDFNVKIGFAENRTDGKSNAMLANILEYGKHGQPAKPFLKLAKTSTKSACISAMVQKLDEEIDKV